MESKVVPEQLGHKTHASTMDHYTHGFAQAHDEAAEVFDRFLRKA